MDNEQLNVFYLNIYNNSSTSLEYYRERFTSIRNIIIEDEVVEPGDVMRIIIQVNRGESLKGLIEFNVGILLITNYIQSHEGDFICQLVMNDHYNTMIDNLVKNNPDPLLLDVLECSLSLHDNQ